MIPVSFSYGRRIMTHMECSETGCFFIYSGNAFGIFNNFFLFTWNLDISSKR